MGGVGLEHCLHGVAQRFAAVGEPFADANTGVLRHGFVEDDGGRLHVHGVLVGLDGRSAQRSDFIRHHGGFGTRQPHVGSRAGCVGANVVGGVVFGVGGLCRQVGYFGVGVEVNFNGLVLPIGHARLVQEVVLDCHGRAGVGLQQGDRAAVHIHRTVQGLDVPIAGTARERVAEVVLDGHIVDQVQFAVIGDADGTHELRMCHGVIANLGAVAVVVILHRGVVLQVHRALVAHLDDGAIGLGGVRILRVELAFLQVVGLQEAGSHLSGLLGSVLGVHLAHHAALEGDAAGREGGVGAVHHNHRAAVGSRVAGQVMMATGVAYHVHRHILLALDQGLHNAFLVVDVHLVDNGYHVTLLIHLREGIVEAPDIFAGFLAGAVGNTFRREVVAGVQRCSVAGHRCGRGQVDGVAAVAGLHVDDQVEVVAVRVVAAAVAHQREHHFAHIALAGYLVVDAVAVIVERHLDGGLATTVQHAEKEARVAVRSYLDRVNKVGGFGGLLVVMVLVAAAHSLDGGTLPSQLVGNGGVEVDGLVGADGVPAHRGDQRVADVVHRQYRHAEVAVGAAGRLTLNHRRAVGQVEVVRVAAVGAQRVTVAVSIADVGGEPRDAAQVQLAALQRGRQDDLAVKVVQTALVVHGQHLVLHVLEVLQDGGDGNLHLDGGMDIVVQVVGGRLHPCGISLVVCSIPCRCGNLLAGIRRDTYLGIVVLTQVHRLILLEGEGDGAQQGVREFVVVEQIEVELGHGVSLRTHLGRGEVGQDVGVLVARQGGAARPGAASGYGGRTLQVAAAVDGKVGTRRHHQAEVLLVAGALFNHVDAGEASREAFESQPLQRAIGIGFIVGSLHIGGVGSVLSRRADFPFVAQVVPILGQVADVGHVHLGVLVVDFHARVRYLVVVTRNGGRQAQGGLGDAQVEE